MDSAREVIENLLKDEYCLIHVNTTVPGISLPDHLRTSPSVTLKISYYFAGSLTLTDKEIRTELRFGGVPYSCVIPLDAVWGATSIGGYHTTWDGNAPHPTLPLMLKKDQKEEKSRVTKPNFKEKKEKKSTKEKPSFLKRIK